MTKVFISYSRSDGDQVANLRSEIEAIGGAAWLDTRLSGGQDWWTSILAEIRQCDLFILAVSRASLASEACTSETDYAISVGRPVLPVVVAPVDLGLLPRRCNGSSTSRSWSRRRRRSVRWRERS